MIRLKEAILITQLWIAYGSINKQSKDRIHVATFNILWYNLDVEETFWLMVHLYKAIVLKDMRFQDIVTAIFETMYNEDKLVELVKGFLIRLNEKDDIPRVHRSITDIVL